MSSIRRTGKSSQWISGDQGNNALEPPGPIVLLTDFGLDDPYVGCLKGVLVSQAPGVSVVDLCHGIMPQDIVHAAFVLMHSYRFFPAASTFLCIVDPGVGSARALLAVKTARGTFVGPDNGIFSPLLSLEKKYEAYRIGEQFIPRRAAPTFHGRDIMAPVTAALAAGKTPISDVGERVFSINKLSLPKPKRRAKILEGEILFLDHYGNAVTNINGSFFDRWPLLQSHIVVAGQTVLDLVTHYRAAENTNTLCALINSYGYLEIALPNGSAARAHALKKGDTVKVLL